MAALILAVVVMIPFKQYGVRSVQNNMKQASKLAILVPSLPQSLDFSKTIYHEHSLILKNLYQTLVKISENGRILGDLSKKWEVLEEGKKYIFHLKESYFHSGRKVTASDVAYTISRQFWGEETTVGKAYLKDILVGASSVHSGSLISGVRVLDEQIVEMKLLRPYPAFLPILSIAALSIVELDNDEVVGGSGPYAIVEKQPKKWVLARKISGMEGGIDRVLLEEIDYQKFSKQIENVDILFGPTQTFLKPEGSLTELTFTDIRGRNHFFFNSYVGLSKNREFRKDVAGLIYQITKISVDSGLCPNKFEPFYFSRGILTDEYYERNLPFLTSEEFKRKWFHTIKDIDFKVVLRKSFLSEKYIELFISGFRKAGIKIEPVLTTLDTHRQYIANRKDFDLIIGAFVGSFPDPDGYLDPLIGTSGLHYGHFPVDSLINKLLPFKYFPSKEDRLRGYSAVMKEFEENEWYCIPVFSATLPVFFRKELLIPDVSLQFAFDLEKIRWR